ncbi:protein piccolo isoform X2 [Engraulis encrasicolus]|uniref:protein piccolo isoform X2 n=1 Tax=Engraulis encrasicolus TaxID=184585 RepID=UPI002FD3DF56
MAEEDSEVELDRLKEELDSVLIDSLSDEHGHISKSYCAKFCKLVEEHTGRWQVPLPQLLVLRRALCSFVSGTSSFPPDCEHVHYALSSLALSIFELLLFFDREEFQEDPLKEILDSIQECQTCLGRHQNEYLWQVSQVIREGGPWAGTVLQGILSGAPLPPDQVSRYLGSEACMFLELRVRYLLVCERVEEAMVLTRACSQHPSAGKHLYFLQAYLTCLWRTALHERFYSKMSVIDGRDAVEMICNCEAEENDDLLLSLSRGFLSQQLRTGDMYYLWDLVFVWSKLQLRTNTSTEDFLQECNQLLLSASNEHAVFPFIKVILAEAGKRGLKFCVELCARGLQCDTDGLLQGGDVVTKALLCKTIAYLLPSDLEVCRICALLVFFLERTVENYKTVALLYTHPDQEYPLDASPVGNAVRFEVLQILKKGLQFDPEFWNLITLRSQCRRLLGGPLQKDELSAVEEPWAQACCVREPGDACNCDDPPAVTNYTPTTPVPATLTTPPRPLPTTTEPKRPPSVTTTTTTTTTHTVGGDPSFPLAKRRGRKPGVKLNKPDILPPSLRRSFRQLDVAQQNVTRYQYQHLMMGGPASRQQRLLSRTRAAELRCGWKRRGRKPRWLLEEEAAAAAAEEQAENSAPSRTPRKRKPPQARTPTSPGTGGRTPHERPRTTRTTLSPLVEGVGDCSAPVVHREVLEFSLPDNEVVLEMEVEVELEMTAEEESDETSSESSSSSSSSGAASSATEAASSTSPSPSLPEPTPIVPDHVTTARPGYKVSNPAAGAPDTNTLLKDLLKDSKKVSIPPPPAKPPPKSKRDRVWKMLENATEGWVPNTIAVFYVRQFHSYSRAHEEQGIQLDAEKEAGAVETLDLALPDAAANSTQKHTEPQVQDQAMEVEVVAASKPQGGVAGQPEKNTPLDIRLSTELSSSETVRSSGEPINTPQSTTALNRNTPSSSSSAPTDPSAPVGSSSEMAADPGGPVSLLDKSKTPHLSPAVACEAPPRAGEAASITDTIRPTSAAAAAHGATEGNLPTSPDRPSRTDQVQPTSPDRPALRTSHSSPIKTVPVLNLGAAQSELPPPEEVQAVASVPGATQNGVPPLSPPGRPVTTPSARSPIVTSPTGVLLSSLERPVTSPNRAPQSSPLRPNVTSPNGVLASSPLRPIVTSPSGVPLSSPERPVMSPNGATVSSPVRPVAMSPSAPGVGSDGAPPPLSLKSEVSPSRRSVSDTSPLKVQSSSQVTPPKLLPESLSVPELCPKSVPSEGSPARHRPTLKPPALEVTAPQNTPALPEPSLPPCLTPEHTPSHTTHSERIQVQHEPPALIPQTHTTPEKMHRLEPPSLVSQKLLKSPERMQDQQIPPALSPQNNHTPSHTASQVHTPPSLERQLTTSENALQGNASPLLPVAQVTPFATPVSTESESLSCQATPASDLPAEPPVLEHKCRLCGKVFRGGNVLRHANAHFRGSLQYSPGLCMFCDCQPSDPVEAYEHFQRHIEKLRAELPPAPMPPSVVVATRQQNGRALTPLHAPVGNPRVRKKKKKRDLWWLHKKKIPEVLELSSSHTGGGEAEGGGERGGEGGGGAAGEASSTPAGQIHSEGASLPAAQIHCEQQHQPPHRPNGTFKVKKRRRRRRAEEDLEDYSEPRVKRLRRAKARLGEGRDEVRSKRLRALALAQAQAQAQARSPAQSTGVDQGDRTPKPASGDQQQAPSAARPKNKVHKVHRVHKSNKVHKAHKVRRKAEAAPSVGKEVARAPQEAGPGGVQATGETTEDGAAGKDAVEAGDLAYQQAAQQLADAASQVAGTESQEEASKNVVTKAMQRAKEMGDLVRKMRELGTLKPKKKVGETAKHKPKKTGDAPSQKTQKALKTASLKTEQPQGEAEIQKDAVQAGEAENQQQAVQEGETAGKQSSTPVKVEETVQCSVEGCDAMLRARSTTILGHLLDCHPDNRAALEALYESKVSQGRCGFCMRRFHTPRHFADHAPRHSDCTLRHPCQHQGCTEAFRFLSSVREHMKKSHPQLQITCCFAGCQVTTDSNNNLHRHERRHYVVAPPRPKPPPRPRHRPLQRPAPSLNSPPSNGELQPNPQTPLTSPSSIPSSTPPPAATLTPVHPPPQPSTKRPYQKQPKPDPDDVDLRPRTQCSDFAVRDPAGRISDELAAHHALALAFEGGLVNGHGGDEAAATATEENQPDTRVYGSTSAKPYMRPLPCSYLDERYTSMPKRKKEEEAAAVVTSRPTVMPVVAEASSDISAKRKRCSRCFASLPSSQELEEHLKNCSTLFGFDSDDEGGF